MKKDKSYIKKLFF